MTIQPDAPPTRVEVSDRSDRVATVAFALAIFSASALLFIVEPLAARMILPVLGGSPVVWITAVAFFQVTLLLGYGYAHLTTLLGTRGRIVVHGLVLLAALLSLPVALPAWEAPLAGPYLWLVGLLAVSIGLPFFVLASASPALAHWYAAGGRRDPYFLYAISNAGSFVGLLSYPLIVEPMLGLRRQAALWALGFGAFTVVAVVAVAISVRSMGPRSTNLPVMRVTAATSVGWGRRLSWVGLAFIPSSLLLGSTTYITSEIGSVPLLWVLPLAAYLLTFVVAFRDRARPVGQWPSRATTLLIFGVLTSWAIGHSSQLWLNLSLHVGLLFAAGLVAHLRLYESRPAPERLTEFYLLISFGGALGGVFNAFIAPLLFDWAAEYPIVIVAAAAVIADRVADSPLTIKAWMPPAIVAAVALLIQFVSADATETTRAVWAVVAVAGAAAILLAVERAIVFAVGIAVLLVIFPPIGSGAVYRDRTFFGILSVRETETERSLFHGSTLHGIQFLDERAGQPGAYYGSAGPLGDILSTRQRPMEAGVVGLGVGAVAAYGQRGDTITFFEIDPAVADLAQDRDLFTFLADSAATITIRIEDGRLGLDDSPAAAFDLIVLDAFSADAIPVHLLTVEAIETYADRLAEGGLLAVHISNRFFDLEPVLAGAATEVGLVSLMRLDPGGEDRFASRWVALAKNPTELDALGDLPEWRPLRLDPDFRLWTDDYSNPLAALR